jgi:hypothetical protein
VEFYQAVCRNSLKPLDLPQQARWGNTWKNEVAWFYPTIEQIFG